jgi:hypothetical protein
MSKKIRRSSNLESETKVSTQRRPSEFNPDYSDVIKDLRRIGMLAGSFITILVILSFILR